MNIGIIDEKFVKTIIEKRKREIHKGDCGRILIAAGSTGMAGAAVLAAKAALRAGGGLVQLAVPEKLFPIVQTGVPEATCLERDFSKIDLDRYDAAAIGPGLGESEESAEAVKAIIKKFKKTLVIDADGLNTVAKNDLFGILKERKPGTTVITPHMGETARLLSDKTAAEKTVFSNVKNVKAGKTREEVLALENIKNQRFKIAEMLREKTGAIVVLKGYETLVATGQPKTYTNTTGNPGMATAGSGDVLTGVIAGLAGQKKSGGDRVSAEEAALCGVFIHGAAGDLAAEAIGEYGLTAGDLAYYTAIALKKILE